MFKSNPNEFRIQMLNSDLNPYPDFTSLDIVFDTYIFSKFCETNWSRGWTLLNILRNIRRMVKGKPMFHVFS